MSFFSLPFTITNNIYFCERWDLYIQRGYQSSDTVSSVVTTKVKGLGYVPINQTRSRFKMEDYKNVTDYYMDLYETRSDVSYKIFDTAGNGCANKNWNERFFIGLFVSLDYIIPPNEYNSIFIMTNFIRTQQSQDVCDEVRTNFHFYFYNF